MTDLQCCQQAATAPAGLEKGDALLIPRHLELIRAAQQPLYRATALHSSADERDAALAAWTATAERLAVALVSHLEVIEEVAHG